MRVWLLSAYDQPKGQSTRTYDYAKELAKRGHKVTFFTNSRCHFTHTDKLKFFQLTKIEYIDKIRVIWLKTTPYKGNGFARGINMITNTIRILQSSFFLKDAPEVVLGPSVPLLTGWCAYILSIIYKVPFIFDVRDVWPDALVEMNAIKKNSFIYLIFKYIEKLLYRKSKFISSALPFIHDHVAKYNVSKDKIIYIPNGINLDNLPQNKNYKGGDSNNLNILYIGGFSYDHDVESIVLSAKLLQLENDNRFFFTIIGDGVNKQKCINLAEESNLTNIAFKEPIKKSNIFAVQNKADILIASIKDTTSYRFGINLNKICSYFSSAKPIVFSGNPPNDPVKESMGGISVGAEKPKDIVKALKKLASMKPSERLEIGMNGYNYAKNKINIKELTNTMEKMFVRAIA